MQKFQFYPRYNCSKSSDEHTLADIADLIREGTYTSLPLHRKNCTDEDQQALCLQQIKQRHCERMAAHHVTPQGLTPVKQRSPLMAIAARFDMTGRTERHILALTGYAQIDVDDHDGTVFTRYGVTAEELLRRACQCPHTVMAYRTVSGGLRIIFRYPLDTTMPLDKQHQAFRRAWEAANAFYAQVLGLPAVVVMDISVGKAVQQAALAYDPQCHFNAEAATFTADIIGQYCEEGAETVRMKKVFKRLDARYEQKLRTEVEDKKGVFAKGNHNEPTVYLAHLLNDQRIPLNEAAAWVDWRFGGEYPAARSTVEGIYKNNPQPANARTDKARSERTKVAAISDIKDWLAGQVRFRHNVITDQTEYQELAPEDAEGTDDVGRAQPGAPEQQAWGESNKKYLNTLICRMSEQTGMRVRKDDMECVVQSDFTPDYNPLTSYLRDIEQQNRLPVEVFDGGAVTIDGRDPIHELAQTVQVQGGEEAQRLWTEALRKWLVGAVAAWLNDKVVNEIILVLIGPQGTYKTTWFNYLMPPQLREYFLAKLNADINDRDAVIALSENAIICLEEIDSLLPKELNRLKAAVSARHTKERAAYERFKNRRPHVASFCGTGNNMQFLTDHTGNRRWMPFQVQSITPPQTLDYHHNEVFLQALLCLRHGYQYWLTPDDMQLQNDHNRAFEVPNVEQELVLKYFRKPHEGEPTRRITVSDAMERFGSNSNMRITPASVGRAFSALGFERRKWQGNSTYMVVELTGDEIHAAQKIDADEDDAKPF